MKTKSKTIVAVFLLSFASLLFILVFFKKEDHLPVYKRKYYYIRNKKLGEYISQNYPNSDVLIITIKDRRDNTLNGFIDGLTKVNSINIDQSIQYIWTDEVTSALLNKIIEKNPNSNVFIFDYGLPVDIDNLTLWKEKKSKAVKVVLPGFPPERNGQIYNLLKSGRIDVVVGWKIIPDNEFYFTDPPSKDEKKSFDKYFFLAESKNYEVFKKFFFPDMGNTQKTELIKKQDN